MFVICAVHEYIKLIKVTLFSFQNLKIKHKSRPIKLDYL